MSKLITTLTIIIIFSSCNKHNYFKDVSNCVNEKYNTTNIPIDVKINIMDSIYEYETFLVQAKLLKSRTKKGYDELIKKSISDEKLTNFMINIEESFPFFYEFNDNFLNKHLMYDSCVTKVVLDSKINSINFSPTKVIFQKIFTEGSPNKSIVEEFFNEVNFSNKESRLFLCNLIYLNWRESNLMRIDSNYIKPRIIKFKR